jgi:hypothetical protein
LADESTALVRRSTLDLVAFMRRKGFEPDEIELITVYADPEVVCKTKKAYVEWLAHNRGVYIDYERALRIMQRPEFHECVNLLYTQEKGASLRAVEKALLKRATDPEDAHGVAAARLLYQANGILGKDDSGAGSAEHKFVKLMMDIRQGKIEGVISTSRTRFTVETQEDLLVEETAEDPTEVEAETTTVDADFEVSDEEAEA